jgi:F-type H+-transporting ATPase subunit epsilon
MTNQLRLDIITPGTTAFSDVAEQVILPTSSGEITILVGHVPLITEIEPGELQIIKDLCAY